MTLTETSLQQMRGMWQEWTQGNDAAAGRMLHGMLLECGYPEASDLDVLLGAYVHTVGWTPRTIAERHIYGWLMQQRRN